MSAQQDPSELFAMAEGRSLTQITQQGIGAFLLAVAGAWVAGVQVIVELLLLPFEIGIEIGTVSVQQLVLRPLGLTDFGFAITARELDVFGLFALPVSSVIALGTILIFVFFLSWRITGNVPGSFILDNPLVDRLFQTPEEEGDDPD